MVVQGGWMLALAAVRALEHMVLGGGVTAFLLYELTGLDFDVGSLWNSVLAWF